MQLCEIYFRKGNIYVVSQSSTNIGLYVSVGPMFKANPDVPSEVGTAVLSALNASQAGIAQPENLRPIQNELYSFTDAKGWANLARTSKCLTVQRDGEIVTIQPHRLDSCKAFVPAGNVVTCSTKSEDEIGRTILKVFEST